MHFPKPTATTKLVQNAPLLRVKDVNVVSYDLKLILNYFEEGREKRIFTIITIVFSKRMQEGRKKWKMIFHIACFSISLHQIFAIKCFVLLLNSMSSVIVA